MVQGATGIGLAVVAAPTLIALEPAFVPGPLLMAGLFISVRHLVFEWRYLDRTVLWRCLAGLPFGVVLAIALLRSLTTEALMLSVGVLIVLAAAALLAGFKPERSRVTDTVTGAVATFTSITASLPGPPLIIGFHDLEPKSLRPTVSAYIMVVCFTALISLSAVGRFGRHEVELLGLLAPGTIAGVVISRWVRPWLDGRFFHTAVLLVALVSGLLLVLTRLT